MKELSLESNYVIINKVCVYIYIGEYNILNRIYHMS